jgi:predicted membrane protein
MNAFHEHHHHHHGRLSTIAVSLAFIFTGAMFLAHNLGWVSHCVFSIAVSWQMLLIYIGLFQLIKKNPAAGLILITVGAYFLLPSNFGLGVYWPVLLIAIGVVILFKLRNTDMGWGDKRTGNGMGESAMTDNGFVKANVNFGGSKHIVLDPVFQGAGISVSFGSMTMDLRRTALEKSETVIDLDCNFGGIELYIPSHWNVTLRMNTSFGNIEDKRIAASNIDYEHELIIRGEVNFGGVEIKC